MAVVYADSKRKAQTLVLDTIYKASLIRLTCGLNDAVYFLRLAYDLSPCRPCQILC